MYDRLYLSGMLLITFKKIEKKILKECNICIWENNLLGKLHSYRLRVESTQMYKYPDAICKQYAEVYIQTTICIYFFNKSDMNNCL